MSTEWKPRPGFGGSQPGAGRKPGTDPRTSKLTIYLTAGELAAYKKLDKDKKADFLKEVLAPFSRIEIEARMF
jgi:hypothetical protein